MESFNVSTTFETVLNKQFKQDSQCTCKVIMRRVRKNIVDVVKCVGVGGCTGAGVCFRACSLTNSACYSSPYFQSAASLAPPHFSTLSHKRLDFRKNITEHKMCILIFSTNLFETFLILRRIQRGIVKNVKTCSCKVPVILF